MCFYSSVLGISLVYWLNLYKTYLIIVYYALVYSIVYRVLSWSARGALIRPRHFPKLAPLATSDAHIGIGQLENKTWFSSDLPCMYWRIILLSRVWSPSGHTRRVILILFIIINPALKLENPESCLYTIALFRCVRSALLSTLREVRVL